MEAPTKAPAMVVSHSELWQNRKFRACLDAVAKGQTVFLTRGQRPWCKLQPLAEKTAPEVLTCVFLGHPTMWAAAKLEPHTVLYYRKPVAQSAPLSKEEYARVRQAILQGLAFIELG